MAEAFPAAREVFRTADEVLGFPLSELCWKGPEEELRQTENAQPAILVHSLAAWAVTRGRLASRVRHAAGHSLGEFSAYAAAGALALPDAVRLVRRRGELMAAARAGTMSAIVGLEPDAVEEICDQVAASGGTVVAANFNSPVQIVISGEAAAVGEASKLAKAAGARMVKPLPVGGAFHSPLMAEAEAGLHAELDRVPFRDPEFPIVANATAEPVREAAVARISLVRQLTAPVRWTQSILRIAETGVDQFVELGPGKVLTGLLRRIDPGLRGSEVGGPEDVERLGRDLS